MLPNIPDWFPFACLVTNKIVQKPGVTRLAEGLLIGLVSGAFTFWLSVHDLQKDFDTLNKKLEFQAAWANSQFARSDVEMGKANLAREKADEEILKQLRAINTCLMVRSCTK